MKELDTIRKALEHGEEVYGNLAHVINDAHELHDLFTEAIAALSTIDPEEKPQEPSKDAMKFLELLLQTADNWAINPETLEESYIVAAGMISAHDDAIRRECANRAVSLLRLIRLSDEWGDLTNERMISAILGTEPAREES